MLTDQRGLDMNKLRNIVRVIVLWTLIFVVISCDGNFLGGDYLDKTPEADLTIEEVFSTRNNAESFLASMYEHIPNESSYADNHSRNPFIGASDEMEITFRPAFSHNLNSGGWSADLNYDIWGNAYRGIRKTNIFLENIDDVPMDPQMREQWKGQAIFLRAFYHFFNFRVRGPIPIVDQTFPTDADFTTVKRQPVEAVVDFIVSECDRAVEILDMEVPPERKGQATKAAALALKARTLLYFASPLYNGNPDYQGFIDQDGTHLFPQQYVEARWQAAADAAKDVIDQTEAAGYGLYRSDDNDPVKSYQELFTEAWNKEWLFAGNFGTYAHFDYCLTPIGMGGYSIFCPTQNIVDDYETENGKQPILGYNPDGSPIINPEANYNEEGYVSEADPEGYYPEGVSRMYANREPRFYASINFSGQFWKRRQVEFWFTGIDGRRNAGSDYNISGYLLKKMAHPSVNIAQGIFEQNPWLFFRLGEQYLNYAEALNETQGPVANVYTYVNAIRDRAGLPDLPEGLSKEEMRDRIHHERRIELAFETHRYFDTHRWKIAEQTQSGPIYGMTISAGDSLRDDAFYNRRVIENRVFESPKHYLWPIPQDEIDKNPNLLQNPGW